MRLPSVGVVVNAVAATRRLCWSGKGPAAAGRRRKSAWLLFKIPLLFAALREIFSALVIFPGCELPVLISLCWGREISTYWTLSFRFF
jgi:hypothetical protein